MEFAFMVIWTVAIFLLGANAVLADLGMRWSDWDDHNHRWNVTIQRTEK